jgi:hypothetical protein
MGMLHVQDVHAVGGEDYMVGWDKEVGVYGGVFGGWESQRDGSGGVVVVPLLQ